MSSFLSKVLAARSLTQSELARRMGVSRQSVYAWCNGALPRSPQTLSKLAQVLGVNSDALIAQNDAPVSAPSDGFVDIPYLHGVEASCGGGSFSENFPDISRIRVSHTWLRSHAPTASANSVQIITADGDSMQPTIDDGDMILIDVSRTEAGDAIYALVINGRLYIKRLQRTPKGLRVISDNPIYPPFDLDASDSVRIIGRVCCRASFKNL